MKSRDSHFAARVNEKVSWTIKMKANERGRDELNFVSHLPARTRGKGVRSNFGAAAGLAKLSLTPFFGGTTPMQELALAA